MIIISNENSIKKVFPESNIEQATHLGVYRVRIIGGKVE